MEAGPAQELELKGWKSEGPSAVVWLPVARSTLTRPQPPKRENCPGLDHLVRPQLVGGQERSKRDAAAALTPARSLFPAHCDTQPRACATPGWPLIPAHASDSFPTTGGTLHRPAVRTRFAHCLPGVVVSMRRARQVQWPRSGAAARERRGGSRAATPGTEGVGLAIAGRRRGARGFGRARARR